MGVVPSRAARRARTSRTRRCRTTASVSVSVPTSYQPSGRTVHGTVYARLCPSEYVRRRTLGRSDGRGSPKMVQLRPSFTPSHDLIIALASRRETISPSRPLVRVVPSLPLLRLSSRLIFFRTQMPLSHPHPCGSIIDSSSTLQRPPSRWRCCGAR